VIRSGGFRVVCAASFAWMACDAVPRAGPGLPGGPAAPQAATPSGRPRTASIGPAGDTLTFGALTLTVPPGAVASSVDFTIDEVTPNTAVGASGSAYLVGPSGAALLLPVTLTFAVADSTGLGLSHQDATGYWLRDYTATSAATSLTATTKSLGTWSAVTLATSRDLTGPLRIDSTTEQIPFSASGTVTLQYIGEEPGFSYYMPTGFLAPSAPACVPDPQPATPLPASLAEIHGADFRFGVMTQWTLACGDGSRPFVSTNFDTMGITNFRCTRGYDGASIVDPAHLQGRYVIDCGAGIQVVATWDLLPP
jgi:hypothetical protein